MHLPVNCRERTRSDFLTTRGAAWYTYNFGPLVCLSADCLSSPVYLQAIRVKFVCKGHRVKIKVTEQKTSKIPTPVICKTSVGNYIGVIRCLNRIAAYHVLQIRYQTAWYSVS